MNSPHRRTLLPRLRTVATEILILSAQASQAGSASWSSSPPTNDWSEATNWTPATVPNGAGDKATFGVSSTTSVIISAAQTAVDEIIFAPSASPYTITATPNIFFDTISLTGAGITNNSGITQNFANGTGLVAGIRFKNSATAGSLTAFTNAGGIIAFLDSSTAANTTITNNYAPGSETVFEDTSTADNATIINNGGATWFLGNSTAGAATLTNNGFPGGQPGGIVFQENSTGGTARISLFGNGDLDLIHHSPSIVVGSVEGDGNILLGSTNLMVGSNSLSTSFSGVIQDGGPNGGILGSFTKIGTGTLTLSGANTYTGGTAVNSGALQAFHDSALGSGNVSLTALGAVLTLQNGAANKFIADGAQLSIVTGSVVNLNYTGTPDVIGFLIVDGISQPPGLYGSATSGATHQLSQFTGPGTILVTAPIAVSRKLQGASSYDLNLPFTGARGVECRLPGPNNTYQIVLSMGFPVTYTSASITSGSGSIDSTGGNGTSTLTFNLSGVTNAQRLTLTLFGVNYGPTTADFSIPLAVLLGDTTGDGAVNSSDITQTKAQSGQPLTSANFRCDVITNGTVNASDISLIKSKSGIGLPSLSLQAQRTKEYHAR